MGQIGQVLSRVSDLLERFALYSKFRIYSYPWVDWVEYPPMKITVSESGAPLPGGSWTGGSSCHHVLFHDIC